MIVPHEVSTKAIKSLQQKIKSPFAKWSTFDVNKDVEKQILIVDKIGDLGKIYSYASFAYVGGGMRKERLHNTLEPAAFGIPVIIGPHFKTFQEAINLVHLGGIFTVRDMNDLENIFDTLSLNEQTRKKAGLINREYISKSVGASIRFINKIREIQTE